MLKSLTTSASKQINLCVLTIADAAVHINCLMTNVINVTSSVRSICKRATQDANDILGQTRPELEP